MDVDHSREKMETGGVKRFPRGRHRTFLADGQDLAIFDRDRRLE
jgi:hypothetical protein